MEPLIEMLEEVMDHQLDVNLMGPSGCGGGHDAGNGALSAGGCRTAVLRNDLASS
jgi:hypothetical protein